MSSIDLDDLVQSRLLVILSELDQQSDVAQHYSAESLPYHDEMQHIRRYIVDAREFGIAYESLVACLEQQPFSLSGQAAVLLLEVGLIMQYKTDRPNDYLFDHRRE